MRARGEERGPFPYKRSLIKDLGNGQFVLVDQTMGGLPGLHIFPYIWLPALLGFPSTGRGLILHWTLHNKMSMTPFTIFFKLHRNQHPHLLLSLSFSIPQRKDVWQLQGLPWFILKMFVLCQRNTVFFLKSFHLISQILYFQFWVYCLGQECVLVKHSVKHVWENRTARFFILFYFSSEIASFWLNFALILLLCRTRPEQHS